MDKQPILYDQNSYLETNRGNKISKKTLIRGTDQIKTGGKTIFQESVIIRGDLTSIKFGNNVIFRDFVTVRPAYKKTQTGIQYVPMVFGDYIYVDSNTIICANKIGSNVHIGKNCVIGHRCIIEDNCKILDDTILAPETHVPSNSVYGGQPGKFLYELQENFWKIIKQDIQEFYELFIPDPNKTKAQQQTQKPALQQSQQSSISQQQSQIRDPLKRPSVSSQQSNQNK